MHTLAAVIKHGGFLYSSDSYNDDLPYWVKVEGTPHLIIPYTLEVNDMKFGVPPGYTSGDGWLQAMKDSFDVLYAEGAKSPKMMSIGLHCRLVGRPSRAATLARLPLTAPARLAMAIDARHAKALERRRRQNAKRFAVDERQAFE